MTKPTLFLQLTQLDFGQENYVKLGNNLAVLQGHAHDAAWAYSEAINCSPNAMLPHYNLGALLSKCGYDGLALKQMFRSIALAPTGQWCPLPWQGVGIILTRQARYREALDAFRQALILNPKDHVSYLSLAQAMRGARRPTDARKLAVAALKLQPRDAEVMLEISSSLRDEGYGANQVEFLEEATVAGMNLATHLQIAKSREREAFRRSTKRLSSYIGMPSNNDDASTVKYPLIDSNTFTADTPEDETREEAEGACEVDLKETKEHLPRQISAPGERCPGNRAAHVLRTAIWRQQYPRRCLEFRSAVYEAPFYGFGSVVNYAISTLGLSFMRRETYIPDKWSLPGYTSQSICGDERTLACFLASPTNCSTEIPKRIIPVRPDPYPSVVPMQLQGYANAAFWYRSMIAGFLWRLRPEVSGRIEAAKVSMGYKRPIMAIHVRHGDACSGRQKGSVRKCYALEQYMVHARAFREKYGIRRIFLATDDAASVEWARENSEGFEWVIPEIDRSKYVSDKLIEERLIAAGARDESADVENLGAKLDGGLEGQTIVQEIEMLASADAFIGQFSGNVDRVAFTLMADRLGMIPPYVSMDIAWCSHWGHERRFHNGKYYFC